MTEERVAELEAALAEAKAETRAVKATVRNVAQKYAKAHNWCSVVDQALAEAGVGTRWMQLAMTAMVQVEAAMEVDAEHWESMGEEERASFLSGNLIPAVGLSVPNSGSGLIRSTRARPGGIEIIGHKVGPTADLPPAGFDAMFTGVEGRVRHFVPTVRRNYLSYAMCGKSSADWIAESPRDEGRTCASCARSAGNN